MIERRDPPLRAGEVETVLAFLDYHRDTLRRKLDGLDREQLGHTLPPSTMTLGGLVKHLTLVEENWFSRVLEGNPYAEPWASVPWDDDPDWEWRTGALDAPHDVQALWRAAVERSRALVADAVAERGLDGPASFTWPDGRTPTVRDMILDMIEEYARHTGHADILREAVDGRAGEGAPEDFALL